MTQEQVVLAILGALLIVDVVLLASIPIRIRRRRPSPDPVAATDHEDAEGVPPVAAIETFVDGVSPEAPEPARLPSTASEPALDPLAALADPATVVMAELPHLDRIVGAFGHGVADRVVTETARVLVSEGRESDRITQLGEARFGILLAETEESAAGAYVERVRAATGNWLESVGLLARLSFGWASPVEGQSVAHAAVAAEERMHEASRRALVGRSPAK